MTTDNPELRKEKVETLNKLIRATRDSAAFYADAAKSVQNPALRRVWLQLTPPAPCERRSAVQCAESNVRLWPIAVGQ